MTIGHRPPASLPGAWLLTIARAVFDEPALSHAALPTIADYQQEWIEAGASRGRRWLARWRGYVAFWSLVVMAPIVFRSSPGRGQRDSRRARRLVIGIGTMAAVTVIAGSASMDTMMWLIEAVPAATWRAMGVVGLVAGPLAIALALRLRRTAPSHRSLHASTAMVFSLLSVTIVAAAGGASVVGYFSGISGHGSPGVLPLIRIVSDTSVTLRNGLLVSLVCFVVAGTISVRGSRQREPATSLWPVMSRRQAVALSGLLGMLLLGADQLLRANHETMHWLDATIRSLSTQPYGQASMIADGLESSLGKLLGGGLVLTMAVFVAGVMTWRATRARTSHDLFTWVSRVALVVAVAGAAYHTTIVVTDLASFHEAVDRLKEFEATRPR